MVSIATFFSRSRVETFKIKEKVLSLLVRQHAPYSMASYPFAFNKANPTCSFLDLTWSASSLRGLLWDCRISVVTR